MNNKLIRCISKLISSSTIFTKAHYNMGLIIFLYIYISLQAFIRAWRATCDFRGNSRLLIPGGTFYLAEVVFEGPCNGPSPKVVQIIGTLLASTDPSDFSSSAWILFESIVGLIVTGRGTIDGQGPAVWKYSDCNNNNNCSPLASVSSNLIVITHLIMLLKILNDITLNRFLDL